jgi:hypothetical protein
MRLRIRDIFGVFVAFGFLALLTSCKTGGGVPGNENGSSPINESEAHEYNKAIVRCYKTGGTRVVKIMGSLRCY